MSVSKIKPGASLSSIVRVRDAITSILLSTTPDRFSAVDSWSRPKKLVGTQNGHGRRLKQAGGCHLRMTKALRTHSIAWTTALSRTAARKSSRTSDRPLLLFEAVILAPNTTIIIIAPFSGRMQRSCNARFGAGDFTRRNRPCGRLVKRYEIPAL